jgi:hypothetical protein
MQIEEKEICPRCQEKFDCSKSNKCWCYEIGLDSNQLEKLTDEFKSCLCPNCIDEIINAKKV